MTALRAIHPAPKDALLGTVAAVADADACRLQGSGRLIRFHVGHGHYGK